MGASEVGLVKVPMVDELLDILPAAELELEVLLGTNERGLVAAFAADVKFCAFFGEGS